ncbi:endonuclease/exonuclease/phosphatase family protein [Seohaeicola zhoushanensis]|uniref:Endonuclease n=1 Tax=Seohaeicola zhoushanensis TaxID=1569283 RepID=A0A8J3GV31_9RHOB|nr:endonuclease/exonuclease/phosphatase family protein [Seohaeicola zhoushanensis]GHF39471.1 endonuclease [Seohaeicola zhoushanensis]
MRLKVASYNIHKAVGFDRRRRPERILSVLNTVNADLVVLQEADLRLGSRPTALPRFLIEQDTDYEVVDIAETDVSIGWHGNAMLLRRGLVAEEINRIELPGLEPRGAVSVRIGGLDVVGAHLGLLRRWRLLQMTAILQHLGDRAEHSLVVGDFNEWSARNGFEPWANRLAIASPGRSFPAIRPVAGLDRYAHGARVHILESGIETRRPAHIASDHLPMWLVAERK